MYDTLFFYQLCSYECSCHFVESTVVVSVTVDGVGKRQCATIGDLLFQPQHQHAQQSRRGQMPM